jgi:hypothetical protein
LRHDRGLCQGGRLRDSSGNAALVFQENIYPSPEATTRINTTTEMPVII